MSNPFDALSVARDLVRQDECQELFDQIRAEEKRVETAEVNDYHQGYKLGLDFVMDLLDERIGYLRDRWE